MTVDRWLTGLLILGLVFYGAWTAFVVATNRPVDFYVYVIGASGLSRGIDIYNAPRSTYDQLAAEFGISNYEGAFQYPLFTALIVRLLSFLPLKVMASVWIFGSGLASLASGFLLGRGCVEPWKRRLILLAAIGFVPTLTTMNAGQINAYVLLFTIVGLLLLQQAKEGRGGFVLALGLWLKPLAALLAGLLLWRWRGRAIVGIAVASVAILAITTITFGPSLAAVQFGGSGGFLSLLGFAHPANDNFNGLFSRWFTPNDFGTPLIAAPFLAVAAYLVTAALLLIADLWLLWPSGPTRVPLLAEAAIVVVTTHLIVPLTWYHHLTMTFIGFAVLIASWRDWRRSYPAMVALGVAYMCLAIHGLFWHAFVGQTLLLDLATWAELLIWILLALDLYRLRTSRSLSPR
jgi:glycosyl transferase family 87